MEPQRRERENGLEDDPAGHLRLPRTALGELVGMLDDLQAQVLAPVGHLRLEPVARVFELPEIEPLEGGAAEHFESRSGVVDPEADDPLDAQIS